MNFVHVCIKDGVVSSMSGVEESHVTCLMLSRDLNNVVFGTAEGWVKIYNCPKNDVRNLVRHEDPVTSVVISDFLPYVVSGSVDKAVNITNIDTCVTVTCLGHEDTVREEDLYRKVKHNISHRIVLIKNLSICLYYLGNLNTNHYRCHCILNMSIFSPILYTSLVLRDVRLIQRGEKVLSCSLTGKLNVWNTQTGKLELTVVSGCTDHATCLDVADRDGETVAAVSGPL